MPEISRFFGIIIRMYFDDHAPSHFHALYGSDEAVFAVETLACLRGSLPPRATALVVEWAVLHRGDLTAAWEKAKNLRDPGTIEPLR